MTRFAPAQHTKQWWGREWNRLPPLPAASAALFTATCTAHTGQRRDPAPGAAGAESQSCRSRDWGDSVGMTWCLLQTLARNCCWVWFCPWFTGSLTKQSQHNCPWDWGPNLSLGSWRSHSASGSGFFACQIGGLQLLLGEIGRGFMQITAQELHVVSPNGILRRESWGTKGIH